MPYNLSPAKALSRKDAIYRLFRISNFMTKTALVILALIAPAFIVSPASNDIYIHIGNDGVMSFTNRLPPLRPIARPF